MVTKTALITLVSSLLIAILALTVEKSGTHLGPAPDPTAITAASANWSASGGRNNWGASSITGASGSYGGGGQRGNWGGSAITGASGSYGGGGERGDWGDDDHDDHDDGDHDGGDWGDDD